MLRRGGQQNGFDAAGVRKVGRRLNARGQADPWQKHLVLMAGINALHDVCLARPKKNLAALGGGDIGEGGSPRPGTDHRERGIGAGRGGCWGSLGHWDY